jgi:3-oxoacyl-[acyl-carrier protein] reductase
MGVKKTAIVTGASKGIGKAIALKLAKVNYDVAIFGRDEKKIKRLKKSLLKIGSNTEFYIGDVADKEFVDKSVKNVLKKYRKIDVLINNAGVAHFEKFVDSSLDNFQDQINTNVIGVYNFCKAAVRSMIKRNQGTIVNIVSQAGLVGFQYGTTYAATKHAVMGFSKSLLLELRKHNIRVIAICPGSVDTDMIADSPIHKEIKQSLKTEDISDIVFASISLPNRALVNELNIRPTNP